MIEHRKVMVNGIFEYIAKGIRNALNNVPYTPEEECRLLKEMVESKTDEELHVLLQSDIENWKYLSCAEIGTRTGIFLEWDIKHVEGDRFHITAKKNNPINKIWITIGLHDRGLSK